MCPGWSSRVVEMHTYMSPSGVLCCAGVTLEVTVPGAGSHQEFGKAATPRNFGDDAKNAMSDALKRCAMRFGVALDLWESGDEYDEDADENAGPYVKGAEGVGPPASAFRQQLVQRPTAPYSNGSAPARVSAPPTAQNGVYAATGQSGMVRIVDAPVDLAAPSAPQVNRPPEGWTTVWTEAKAQGIKDRAALERFMAVAPGAPLDTAVVLRQLRGQPAPPAEVR